MNPKHVAPWLRTAVLACLTFALIATGHALLIVFGLSRMLARPTVEHRTRYVYAPRTSFTIGRLTRRQREKPTRVEEAENDTDEKPT